MKKKLKKLLPAERAAVISAAVTAALTLAMAVCKYCAHPYFVYPGFAAELLFAASLIWLLCILHKGGGTVIL